MEKTKIKEFSITILRKRLFAIFFAITFLFLFVLGRLLYVQVIWGEDLQKKAEDPRAKVMILCNPHNPAGRVWSKEELEHIGKICLKNNIAVVADEFHCELIRPGFVYTPFASLNKDFLFNSITCTSPSKAFNLAGLQTANIFCADKEIRNKIEKALHINETALIGPFGIDALIAA